MKKSQFTTGEKLSTVLNFPVLSEGTVPMHVLLEVLDGGTTIENIFVPNTKAIAIAPIEDTGEIKTLLERNKKYLPNRLRLRLQQLHSEMSDTVEALNLVQKNTVDVAQAITSEAQKITARIDRREALKTVPFKVNPGILKNEKRF